MFIVIINCLNNLMSILHMVSYFKLFPAFDVQYEFQNNETNLHECPVGGPVQTKMIFVGSMCGNFTGSSAKIVCQLFCEWGHTFPPRCNEQKKVFGLFHLLVSPRLSM